MAESAHPNVPDSPKHVVHPDLLPPRTGIVIFPPDDRQQDSRYWFVGFVSKDGDEVPLGRIVWHGDIIEDSLALDDGGNAVGDIEEFLEDPPPGLLEFVREHMPK